MLLNPFMGASAVGAGGVTYFFEERFEGTGYQYSGGWTESGAGTVDEDYTGVVLEGSQSLRIAAAAQQPLTISGAFPSDENELWGFFKFYLVTATSANRNIFSLRNSSATVVLNLNLQADNGWVVQAGTTGSASAVTVDKMSLATTYNVWWHWLKGTGADAVGSVGFSSSGTEVTAGNAYKLTSTGSSTTDAHDLRVGVPAVNTTVEFVIDQILMSTTGTIGDSPA